MDHLSRSPLKLVQEMDARLRGLERQAAGGDPEAQAQLARSRQRAGVRPDKPDNEHHWRFNGKGWYTRPDWNGGRCPPGSTATDHNSCLPERGHNAFHPADHAQYDKSISAEPFDDNGRTRYWHTIPHPHAADYGDAGEAMTVMTNLPHGRLNRMQPANSIDWGHPDGPQLYFNGYRFRPLPADPAHLPEITANRGLARTKARLLQHYVDQGFHPQYVDQSMGSRTRRSYQRRFPRDTQGGPISPETIERIPEGLPRERALRGIEKRRQKVQRANKSDMRARLARAAARRGRPSRRGPNATAYPPLPSGGPSANIS